MKYKIGDVVKTKVSQGTILNTYNGDGFNSYLIRDAVATNWTYGEFIIGKIDDWGNDTQSCVFNYDATIALDSLRKLGEIDV